MKYTTKSKIKFFLFFLFDLFIYFAPKSKKSFPENISNILIVKPDHFGDVLMMTTILPLLKKQYPMTNIDILCGEWGVAILDNNPYIRNKIIINGYALNRKNISYLSKILEFLRTLRHALPKLNSIKYDLCLYMRNDKGNMIPLHWLLHSTYSVGYGTRALGGLLDKEVKWEYSPHEVDSFINICAAIGIKVSNRESLNYLLFPTQNDEKIVDNIIKKYNIIFPFTVIHMGAGDKSKLLQPRQWCDIIKEEIDDNSTIVFTGLNSEVKLFLELKCQKKEFIKLYGKLTIQQLYVLMKKSAKIYTLDSLAAHIAGMTTVPTTSYYKYDPIYWGPYNAKNMIIQKI